MRKNIIVVFSDQQRADTCGCYGQKLDVTPNLDRIARDGVLFRKAFSMQRVGGPARAALQTGLYPTETMCFRNGIALPRDSRTLAQAFNENGYETAYVGKWHLATTQRFADERRPQSNYAREPVPPAFRGGYRDFWLASDVLEFTSHSYDGHMFDGDGNRREFPEGRYRVEAQTDWVLDYLENRDSDRPFFLFNSYIEPHHQNDHDCYEGPHGSKERFADYEVPGDLVGTEGDWRENYPDYLGCCHSLDENLGRIRAKLEELGIADDTVIVYTSDHGSHFRTRNGEYKRSCHEASIRIPMVVCGPGFEGGREVDELVSLMDLPNTILRMAGIAPWDGVQGNDMSGLLDGSARDWPREVFFQISESHVGRGIRTDKWKYAVAAPGKSGSSDAFADVYKEAFLYDLEADPHERSNLVGVPALTDVRAELRQRLLRRMAEANEPPAAIVEASGAST